MKFYFHTQLRGRSGRQGDPGKSSFFLSLEDDLMRIFGSERLEKVLNTLGMKEDEAIVHPWVNKSLEKAQAKVEGRNFDIRKQLGDCSYFFPVQMLSNNPCRRRENILFWNV